jgi:hypothetical protein
MLADPRDSIYWAKNRTKLVAFKMAPKPFAYVDRFTRRPKIKSLAWIDQCTVKTATDLQRGDEMLSVLEMPDRSKSRPAPKKIEEVCAVAKRIEQ